MSQPVCTNAYLGQWIFVVVACICLMTCAQGYAWTAAALPKIRSGEAGFFLTEQEQTWAVTCVYIGNILSPIPAGYIMDKIGRKKSLMTFSLLNVISWIIVLFVKNAWGLYIARTLQGIWESVGLTILPLFIGEVTEPKIRGIMGGMIGVMLYTATLYESIAGFWSYDVLTIISGVPSALVFISFFFIAESPYYYLMKGKREKARKGYTALRGKCTDDDLKAIDSAIQEQLERSSNFTDIFKSNSCWRAFIIVEVLGIVQRFSGGTIIVSFMTITVPDSFVTAEQSFAIVTVVWILMSFASTYVLQIFGRKVLMFVSCIGAGLGVLGVSIWFYLRDVAAVDVSQLNWMPLMFIIINGIFYTLGIVQIPNLMQGELYPINIKGKASAIACITYSVISGIAVQLYQPLNHTVGIYANFLFAAFVCFAGALFSLTYMVETKGKTLEEIQDILKYKCDKSREAN